MKCQYCGAKINDSALFCNSCGQAVDDSSILKKNMDSFWQNENNNKQQEIIKQLEGLSVRCEHIQETVARGKKLESRKLFFESMLIFLILAISILGYSIYKIYGNADEQIFNLCISAVVTIIADLIITTYATIIIEDGAIGLFYPLIPIFGYYYFLCSVCGGLGRLIVPLKKDEKAFVTELRVKVDEMKLLKKEEKDLKAELVLIDKNILDDPTLKYLKKHIVNEKKCINGWQVTTVIAVIVLIVIFVSFHYFAPTITNINL